MKKTGILFIIAAFLFNACEDQILDKKPLDIITDATVWSDPVLIDDYLNQCYSEMRFYFEMPYGKDINHLIASWHHETITLSDEAQSGWITAPKSHWININGGVNEWWGYPTVRRLNIFIDKMENLEIEVEETYIKHRLAEARFLRAFAYFNMVKRYGGVPLITEVQKLDDPEEELYPDRDKEADIYDFIISEVDAIADDLQEIFGDGRATKYAALALKSRAAMYAASIAQWGSVQLDGIVGIPAERASEYWQKSYNASKDIITSEQFALYNQIPDKVENFRNIFLDENNSEVIFSERFDGIAGKGHIWDMMQVPYSYHVWGGGQQSTVYLEMVESFNNTDGTSGVIDRQKIADNHLWTIEELWGKKDPRFKASVYTHGTPWTHKNGDFILDYHYAIEHDGIWDQSGSYKGVLCRSQSAGRPTPFGMLKYLDKSKAVQHERGYSETDYIVFRLGEIYLNYAEAAIELEKPGDALWAVNEIRKRAGMPEFEDIDREKIRHERKVELAFEGTRYFDLKRWRIAEDELTNSYQGLAYILDGPSMVEGAYDVLSQKFKLYVVPDVSGTPPPYFDAKHYYLPINNTRTSNNTNLVENPGYK